MRGQSRRSNQPRVRIAALSTAGDRRKPSPRRERTDARRRAILEAALKCFATLGFDNTTLADIRAGAQASIGSIYHHFKSKEQLAGALYVEGLADYQQALLDEFRLHRRASRAIRGAVRQHLRWIQENPEWSRYLFEYRQLESVVAVEAAINDRNKSFFHEVLALLQPYFEKGELMRRSPELFGAILIGPSQQFARNWLAGRAECDLAEATRELADAAWSSLRAEKAKNE